MRKNVLKGLMLAPLISGVAHGLLMQNWVAAIFALVFAYSLALVIGLPTFLMLERNQKATLPNLLIAGFIGGCCVGAFFTGVDFKASATLLSLAMFATHGMLVAFAFWAVALRVKQDSRFLT